MNDTNSQPLVSIIIPCREGQKTIVAAIQSLLQQTYSHTEIIVVSDYNLNDIEEKKKADSLSSVILSAFSTLPEGKLCIIDGKKKGPGTARDTGIKAARGELIAFIDDDDLWSQPEKLERQVAYLQAHPEIEVVGVEKVFFIHEGGEAMKTLTNPLDPMIVRNQMLMRNPLIASSVLMRKSAYIKSNGFKPMYLAEDYDLWIRINRKKPVIANVPNTSITYTWRKTSASRKRRFGIAQAVAWLVFKNLPYYPIKGLVTTKLGVVKRFVLKKF